MNPELRTLLLQEIETWQREKLINDALAATLRRRYAAPPLAGAQNLPPVPNPPAAVKPAPVVRPTLSLAQAFTSEAFIKVALYLGALFVIAAALILATAETLRLPILTFVGLGFGGAALLLKKRLPQPSFILWLIFGAMGWTVASVLADLFGLDGQAQSLFWLLTYFVLTLFFIFSVWLYRSRFYSLAAYLTLGLAAYAFANFWQRPDTLIYPALGLASLLALALVQLLTAWQGSRFARPLFWLAQAGQALLLFYTLGVTVFFLFQPAFLHVWWPLLLTWALAFGFYLASDNLLPLGIFPFFQAGALLLWPLLALEQVEASCSGFAWGHWGWGLALAAAAEVAVRLPWLSVRRATRFWTLSSLPLFFAGAAWPLFCDNRALASVLFGLAAFTTGLLFFSHRRWWVWAATLVFFQAAYLLVFTVTSWPLIDVSSLVQMSLLLALFALPDWLVRGSAPRRLNWRWPQRLFVVWLALAVLSLALTNFQRSAQSAPALLVLGLVAFGYALRLNRPWFTLIAGSSWLLALSASLADWRFEQIFPLLLAFILAWALLAYALARRLPRWSVPMRGSVLVWSFLLTAFTLFAPSSDTSSLLYGIGAALLAWLFVLEAFARAPTLELLAYPMLGAAFWHLTQAHTAWPGQMLAQSLLMVGSEALFARLSRFPRPWRFLPLWLGGTLMLVSAWMLFAASNVLPALQASLALIVFFAAQTALRRSPLPAYLSLAAMSASLLFGLRYAGQTSWLTAQIGLATLFCLGGWAALRAGISPRWGQVPLFSGLALAAAASLLAPLESSDSPFQSLPLTLGATLWALEAFRRRNVWLGFPANGLYLLAYFTLLWHLDVNQPQFYSVGAALLGLVMHYLLLRAGSSRGAFFTGLISQLILQGVTYGQMVANNALEYFVALFWQSLVVMLYGLVVRSRSLVFFPIGFVVLGVLTVVLSILQGPATILLIGCTGLVLIVLSVGGILARERFASLRARLDDWRA